MVCPSCEEGVRKAEEAREKLLAANRENRKEEAAKASASEEAVALNKSRAVAYLTSQRLAVSDDGDRLVLEGGAASLLSPFSGAADCRATNPVVLDRIKRLVQDM